MVVRIVFVLWRLVFIMTVASCTSGANDSARPYARHNPRPNALRRVSFRSGMHDRRVRADPGRVTNDTPARLWKCLWRTAAENRELVRHVGGEALEGRRPEEVVVLLAVRAGPGEQIRAQLLGLLAL